MSTDALLTLIGLVVAVVTLLSPERRLDLRMRIRPLDVAVVAAAFVVLNYIKFLPVATALGIPSLGPWRWGFDPDIASYLAVLISATFVAVRIRTARLHPRRIGVFQNLAESLLFSGRFAELMFLLERHLAPFRRLLERKYLTMRVHDWVEPPDALEELMLQRDHRVDPNAWRAKAREMFKPVQQVAAGLLPSHDERRRQAERLMERVFLSEPFVEYLAKARPYLGLKVLEAEGKFFNEAFLKMYVVALLKDRNSVLYEEVARGQNLAGVGRYRIEPLNPVLFFFFGGDRFWAEELALYKAVGDAVSEELERRHREPNDSYRATVSRFSDEGTRRCPIYVGIRLFDYMVTEGLHRGVHWHLWLMYLEHWTEDIVANMRNLPSNVDHSREYPTPYHFLLYNIVGTLQDWTETATRVDQTLKSVQIDRVDLEHDTIAKSSVLSMAACLRIVVESPNISPEFKGYLADVVIHGYEKTRPEDKTPLSELYALAVLEGAQWYGDKAPYLAGLAQAVPHMDEARHYMGPNEDLFDRLRERVARR